LPALTYVEKGCAHLRLRGGGEVRRAQACPALTVNARRASALSTSSSSWSALIAPSSSSKVMHGGDARTTMFRLASMTKAATSVVRAQRTRKLP
jgi:hypothetical protein